ncbi:MAG TPA: hypothetical protein VKA04_10815, partial [Pseudodesulfovibrio sp.]|nr:hypothetical protein [Pseudodesulfovibrio sp.]
DDAEDIADAIGAEGLDKGFGSGHAGHGFYLLGNASFLPACLTRPDDPAKGPVLLDGTSQTGQRSGPGNVAR